MCKTMSAEERFINDLKMFFNNNEAVVNETAEKRIRFLLGEYKGEVIKDCTIYVKVKGDKEEEIKPPSLAKKVLRKHPEYKPLHLILLAREICTKYGLKTKDFYARPKTGKSKAFIVEARIEFCKDALENFPVNANRLSEFFNVNHATISYYLHGKKIRIKNKF